MAKRIEVDLTDEQFEAYSEGEKVFKFLVKSSNDQRVNQCDYINLIFSLGMVSFRIIVDQMNPSDEELESFKNKFNTVNEKQTSRKIENEMSPELIKLLKEMEKKMRSK